MKYLLVLLFLPLLSTAQRQDTSKAEHLMYHYDSLARAMEDSQRVHKDNIILYAQFFLQQRDYNDSVRKYYYKTLRELDSTLDGYIKLQMLKDDLQKLLGDTLQSPLRK